MYISDIKLEWISVFAQMKEKAYRRVRSKSPPPLINTPPGKGPISNCGFLYFSKTATTDDFCADALNTPLLPMRKLEVLFHI